MLHRLPGNTQLYKPCSLCKKNKVLSEFHNHKLGVYGKHPRCKACVLPAEYAARNTPERLAKAKEWRKLYKQRPDVKAKNREHMRGKRTGDAQ